MESSKKPLRKLSPWVQLTLLLTSACSTVTISPAAWADYSAHPKAKSVIETLVSRHGFTQEDAQLALSQATTEQRILDSMANAAEKTKTWSSYRDGFLSDFRIKKGAEFLQQHAALFERTEQQYGVPAQVITAILGVETNYGGYTGKANVLNALATLAFEHPRRAAFFSSELIEFIVLCREQGWQLADVQGSYAGAMGMSQFMPSNYRRLAVDGNADGRVDLFNPEDAVPSIANYLRHHGWQPGQPVATRAAVNREFDASVIGRGLKPNRSLAELEQAGYFGQRRFDSSLKARVVRFNDADGDEFWLGLQNFYAISRYNPRAKYAMAVYLLSEAIRERATTGDVSAASSES